MRGMKNSKALKIGEGGENEPFSHNSLGMGSRITTHGSPSPLLHNVISFFSPFFKFEKSWV